jgi:TRAP-type C4-dicarboxylate transport system permease small subunit
MDGGSAEHDPAASSPGPVDLVAGALAVAGGLVMLGVAILVTVSVTLRWSGLQPIPGDFEFVQMATAVAVFAFLPYCQLRRANISVDTFTTWLPARANAVIDAFWDVVYAAAIALLAWCLSNGAADMYRNGTGTMVLGLVMWPAIATSMVLAWVLAATACVTGYRRLVASARRP